jgi:hypothetical protein
VNVRIDPSETIHPVHKVLNKDLLWILCEICLEVIAVCDKKTLLLPFKASMFHSPDPLHELPDPFYPGNDEFEFMLCPHCRHRFAVEEGRVRTQDGMYEVPGYHGIWPAEEEASVFGEIKPVEAKWFAMPQVEIQNIKQKEIIDDGKSKQEREGQNSQGAQSNGQKRKRGK